MKKEVRETFRIKCKCCSEKRDVKLSECVILYKPSRYGKDGYYYEILKVVNCLSCQLPMIICIWLKDPIPLKAKPNDYYSNASQGCDIALYPYPEKVISLGKHEEPMKYNRQRKKPRRNRKT